MKEYILAGILALTSGMVLAGGGGGKIQNPWQGVEVVADECVLFLPAGIDTSDCIELSSNTSGITYFCETLETTVVCDPDAKLK